MFWNYARSTSKHPNTYCALGMGYAMWCSPVLRWSLLCVVVYLHSCTHHTGWNYVAQMPSSLAPPAPPYTFSVPHSLACTSSSSYIPSISITHPPSVPLLVTHFLPSHTHPELQFILHDAWITQGWELFFPWPAVNLEDKIFIRASSAWSESHPLLPRMCYLTIFYDCTVCLASFPGLFPASLYCYVWLT